MWSFHNHVCCCGTCIRKSLLVKLSLFMFKTFSRKWLQIQGNSVFRKFNYFISTCQHSSTYLSNHLMISLLYRVFVHYEQHKLYHKYHISIPHPCAISESTIFIIHSGLVWSIFSMIWLTWKHRLCICLSQNGNGSRSEKISQIINKLGINDGLDSKLS